MVVASQAPALSVATAADGRSTGDALSPKFRVERVLGAGEMAIVVAAHHIGLDKRVAIKLMRPELRERPELVHRFLREARATARLTSPHAVRVFDVSSLDDGTPYLVMEYLDGTDLASWLQHRGAQSPASAAALVLQACHAIGEAHAQRLVHRDLKPANLFVCDAGHAAPVVKVLDLGSCKFLDEPDELETASTTGLGTPAYMAPEQLRSARRSDLRSDVWSLGVILYELVTGRLPFPGRTVPELRLRTTQDPCPPIHRADTGAYASAAFETTVARCLAKEPAARFQDAGELAAALAPLAGSPTRVSAAPMRSPWRWLSVIVFVVLAIGAALALAR